MKLFAEADVCLKITVEEDRCTVAEMDFISLAIMYQYGGAECGRKNIPVNPKIPFCRPDCTASRFCRLPGIRFFSRRRSL